MLRVDGGALSREFFWAAHKVLAEDLVCGSPVFDGCENDKSISNHDELLRTENYVASAKFMLMSFMAIGVLSPGLSKPVFNYIIGSEEIVIPDPLDFPEYEDQIVARIIKNVKPGHHTTNEELFLARAALEKIIGLPRGLLTPTTSAYYYREFSDHMIINTRSQALNVIRDIMQPSSAGEYLRTHPESHMSVCPTLGPSESDGHPHRP
ncbi:unnamed protein product [Allacma fusca]|uniref:Uncharacterized protein n=1 Tax=Allacma fusca TaxID=39272 RepID=A0A8J2K593_9HEXA|nr:unnamed protein product [Allacma fusca]